VAERSVDLDRDRRFAFGRNWRRFLDTAGEPEIREAERALASMLATDDLRGRRFLDVGSGSGLSSLAARRMGAVVHSFDYDAESVLCTAELRRRHARDDDLDWVVEQGSVLDAAYLASLGTFDVVYAWGVLHHTGALWEALANCTGMVAPGGLLFVAIYNNQGLATRLWRVVKRGYVSAPRPVRAMLVAVAALALWGPNVVRGALRGRPFEKWREYHRKRGMSPMTDLVDWVGGYPFETATPAAVCDHTTGYGFRLVRLARTHGLGCNEFVFEKTAGSTP
jgi:2-polyprenyl-6-hydroxyphenyl methylase/3-demethylubiquinone-9 3-methyltransferase